jgi:hypothetical protein
MNEEPEVMLLSGERVNEALFEWIVGLLGKGHVISVSEDDYVSIVPGVHEDLMFCIQNSPSATRAILHDLLAPKTLH